MLKKFIDLKSKNHLLNPILRIQFTHSIAFILLIVSALFFTNNIVSFGIQIFVAIVILLHHFDDKLLNKLLLHKSEVLNRKKIMLQKNLKKAIHAEKVKTTFLANMSHEIRTPLNAIIGFTKILKRSKNIPSHEIEYLKIIDSSAENLLEIINDILDLSKVENESIEFEHIVFNPIEEFENVVELFSAKAVEKDIDFIFLVDPRLPYKVAGDPLRIKQVLSNLISNAIKFTPNGGLVEICIKLTENSIHHNKCTISFSVKDNGIGIPKEKQESIFSPFTQADSSTTRNYGGTGLGLSISSKIVELMGSKINLLSAPNRGSEFSFTVELETKVISGGVKDYLHNLCVGIYYHDKKTLKYLNRLKKYLRLFATVKIIKNLDNIPSGLDCLFVFGLDIDIPQTDLHIIIVQTHFNDSVDDKDKNIITMPINTTKIFDALAKSLNNNLLHLHTQSKQIETIKYNAKVMVAEDNIVNQQLMEALLDFRNINHTIANDGKEAVELYKQQKFDMIFMDSSMPKLSGMEATKQIREYETQQNLPHTPIVALTANAVKGDKEIFLSSGMDEYMSKPIDENILDKMLEKYLKNIAPKNESLDLDAISKKRRLPKKLFIKLINSFLESVGEDMQNLKKAIENKNFDDIYIYSHKIKGVALNLGLEEISSVSKKIEDLSHQKQEIDYDSLFVKLENEIAKIPQSS